jgi:ABC-2 type transport system permease protein
MPIFDQGYQHWQGELSGHWWRWWTITRRGVRTKFLRLPPELMAGPQAFRVPVWTFLYTFFFQVQTFFCMILIVIVGPGLVSQDLRFNAMPLYFSRPLRRFDYFLGKLGVIAVFIVAVTILPALLAYLLGVLFSLDLGVVRDTAWLVPAILVYGLVIALSAGTLMLALSALSRSSLYVALFWIGVWWVSNAVYITLMALQMVGLATALDGAERAVQRAARAGEAEEAQAAREKAAQTRKALADAMHENWRPLFSYTQNLDRIGTELLDTASAQRKLLEIFTRGRRRDDDVQIATPHPWYWSAGILAGLFGISVWTLTWRVKSLDRLK